MNFSDLLFCSCTGWPATLGIPENTEISLKELPLKFLKFKSSLNNNYISKYYILINLITDYVFIGQSGEWVIFGGTIYDGI